MAQYWIDVADLVDLSDFDVLRASIALTTLDGFPVIVTGVWGPCAFIKSIPAAADMEVMMLHRQIDSRTGGQRVQGVGVRIVNENNHYIFGNSETATRHVRSIVGGTESQLTELMSASSVTEWGWNSLRAIGTTLEARTWQGAASDRPAAPFQSVSDSAIASGRAGIGAANNSAREQYIRILSVGTDGDPAPTGPIGGARRRSPLLLTPW